MVSAPEDYLKRPYSKVLVADESGGYVAEILEFPGCIAEGETAEEAVENLNEAAVAWIEAIQEDGGTVPEPLDLQGYSGRLVLRLPKSLHKEATRRAQVEGVSLNQWIVGAVAERLGTDRYHERIRHLFAAPNRQVLNPQVELTTWGARPPMVTNFVVWLTSQPASGVVRVPGAWVTTTPRQGSEELVNA
jgi:predicted RNase H-like HicB family nuclease